MKLLVVTQALDQDDPTLSVYHDWVKALAPKFDTIEAVCLKLGRYDLPENVRVHSLGKENGRKNRVVYAFRFLNLAWKLRHEYDAVFVHMNQEYILIAGTMWTILGKPVYLWRNHYAGSFATDLAALFCKKIFCTSAHSYTAKYKKTVLMPVGVDTNRFMQGGNTVRTPRSILFLARIAPSKRPDMFVEALGLLLAKSVSFVASVYGDALPENEAYYASLKARAESLGLHDRVRFYGGVNNEKAAEVFRSHQIFVNCSPSGMLDKTIYEAAASGCIVVARSDDFEKSAGEELHFDTVEELAQKLEQILSFPESEQADMRSKLATIAEENGLQTLADRLALELT